MNSKKMEDKLKKNGIQPPKKMDNNLTKNGRQPSKLIVN
jgi:hypothetical protein